MNCLSIDFGTKNIGLAISIQGIIEPIPMLKNDDHFFDNLQKVIDQYRIEKIFVGISEGKIAELTKKFVVKLKNMLILPIETVEESVSTIEANQIFLENNKKSKDYKKLIDSISAAVILRRVIN